MTDQPTKAPRATHTPAEKAAEALAVLQRRLDKLTKSKAALELQALELEPQIEAIHKRIDYALSNPDLPPVVRIIPVAEPEAQVGHPNTSDGAASALAALQGLASVKLAVLDEIDSSTTT